MPGRTFMFGALALALAVGPAAAQSDPRTGGTRLVADDLGSHLYAVTHIGQRWVAVGAWGTVLTSEDTEEWTEISVQTTDHLFDVGGNASSVIAVGEGGTMLASSDGQSWTALGSPTIQWLTSVVRGSDRWVAGGWGGAIVTSRNGVDWEELDAPAPANLESVTWNNQGFVAVGNPIATSCIELPFVLTSADGLTWSSSVIDHWDKAGDVPCVALSLQCAIRQGGKLMVGGQYRVYSSTYDQQWSMLLRATAGSQWESAGWPSCGKSRERSHYDAVVGDDYLVVVGASGAVASGLSGQTGICRDTDTTRDLYGVAFHNGVFIAVGEDGIILKSVNAREWSQVAGPVEEKVLR
jgi:hypothetical protein